MTPEADITAEAPVVSGFPVKIGYTKDRAGRALITLDGPPFLHDVVMTPARLRQLILRLQEAVDREPGDSGIRLRELAEAYHWKCEAYDRHICTGPIRHGCILPANGMEAAAINRHAEMVREELWEQVRLLGFSRREWQEAICRFDHTTNHTRT